MCEMTKFLGFHGDGGIVTHVARFVCGNREYEVTLNPVTQKNIYDCSFIFPDDFSFSKSGCYEVVFDLASNIQAGTPFVRADTGSFLGRAVLRHVESIINDHYTEFNVGMYFFFPDDESLARVYQRIIAKRFSSDLTLEMGFNPGRRGNVLRTSNCYR